MIQRSHYTQTIYGMNDLRTTYAYASNQLNYKSQAFQDLQVFYHFQQIITQTCIQTSMTMGKTTTLTATRVWQTLPFCP